MKKSLPFEIERRRCAGEPNDGPYGAFVLTHPETGRSLNCLVSDGRDWAACGLPGEPWEKVGVSMRSGMPRFEELQYVKTVFWEADETVVEIHPPDAEYVSAGEVWWLWKPPVPIPLPPRQCL